MKALVAVSSFALSSILLCSIASNAESGDGQRIPAVRVQVPGHTEAWLDNALVQVNAMLEKDKSNPKIYAGRAQIYFEMKDYGKAISDISKAISLNSSVPDYYFCRALCRGAQKDVKPAIIDLTKAIELDGGRSEFYFHRGSFLLREKKFPDALVDSRKAVELNPSHCASLVLLGACETNLDHYKSAIDWYTKAIKIEPKNGNTYMLRSGVHKLLGNNAAAQRDQDQAKSLGASL